MKLLIFADSHIFDYGNLNRTPKERLYQFIKLAERIVDVAELYKVSYIIGAGDYTEKPTNRPYVNHITKKFFDILSKYPGLYILGQHDLDTKTADTDESDCNIHLLVPSNWSYADRKSYRIAGDKLVEDPESTDIYFEDYRKTHNKLDKHYDLYITHATIDEWIGQKFDSSVADLVIHGDIHQSRKIGNCISIGTPIQNKMGDQQDSKVIIYDTDTRKYEWVNLDPAHEYFTSAVYTSSKSDAGWHGNVYNKYKAVKVKSTKSSHVELSNDLNLNELVKKSLRDNGLEELHENIVSRIDYHPVSLNFKLRSIKIRNFRSIESLDLEFNEGDKVLIQGLNGSGKTSLVSAIKFLFVYNKSWKRFISHWANSMTVEGRISYEGHELRIIRGSKTLLEVDGVIEKSATKSDLNELINKRYPFLNYIDLYLHRAAGAFSDLSESRRTLMISRIYQTDYFTKCSKYADKLLTETEKAKDKLDSEIKNHKKLLKSYQSKLDSLGYVRPIDSINSDIADLNNRINIARERESKVILCKTLSDLVKSYTDAPKITEEEISELNLKVDKARESHRLLKSQREVYLSGLEFNEKLAKTRSELKNELNDILNGVCSLCHQPLPDTKDVQARKSLIESKLSNLPKEKELTVVESLEVDKAHQTYNELYRDLQGKIATREDSTRVDYKKAADRLREVKLELESMPEYKEDPALMDRLTNELVTAKHANTIKADIDSEVSIISDLMKTRVEKNYGHFIESLTKYTSLLSSTGDVMKSILKYLADEYSDESIKYSVKDEVCRGERCLYLTAKLLVGSTYIAYENLSSGQQVIVGLHFLNNLLSNVGMIVFDESLSHLDGSNQIQATQLISSMDASLILNISHLDNNLGMNRTLEIFMVDGRTQVIGE